MRTFEENEINAGSVQKVRLIERTGYHVLAHRLRYGGPRLTPEQWSWLYRVPSYLIDSYIRKAHERTRDIYRAKFHRLADHLGLKIKTSRTFTYVTLEHRKLAVYLGAEEFQGKNLSTWRGAETEVDGELSTEDNGPVSTYYAWRRFTKAVDRIAANQIPKTYGRILMSLVG